MNENEFTVSGFGKSPNEAFQNGQEKVEAWARARQPYRGAKIRDFEIVQFEKGGFFSPRTYMAKLYVAEW